jgi:hypothetical protein
MGVGPQSIGLTFAESNIGAAPQRRRRSENKVTANRYMAAFRVCGPVKVKLRKPGEQHLYQSFGLFIFFGNCGVSAAGYSSPAYHSKALFFDPIGETCRVHNPEKLLPQVSCHLSFS